MDGLKLLNWYINNIDWCNYMFKSSGYRVNASEGVDCIYQLASLNKLQQSDGLKNIGL